MKNDSTAARTIKPFYIFIDVYQGFHLLDTVLMLRWDLSNMLLCFEVKCICFANCFLKPVTK